MTDLSRFFIEPTAPTAPMPIARGPQNMAPMPNVAQTIGRSPMDLAATMLGAREAPNRAALQEYMKNGGVNLDPATTAWCAAYVNATLKQSGIEGTGSNMARSFLNYGQDVTDAPKRGDLAVLSRGDPNGPQGHVGFFDTFVDRPDGSQTVRLLGGNQGNAVSYADFPADQILGFRRPGEGGGAPVAPPDMNDPRLRQAFAPADPLANMGQPPSTLAMAAAGLTEMLGGRQREEQKTAAEKRRRAALFGQPGLFG